MYLNIIISMLSQNTHELLNLGILELTGIRVSSGTGTYLSIEKIPSKIKENKKFYQKIKSKN